MGACRRPLEQGFRFSLIGFMALCIIVPIIPVILDDQRRALSFQHSVSREIRAEPAGSPSLRGLHREVSEQLRDGLLGPQEHSQMREQLDLGKAAVHVAGSACPPPGRGAGGSWTKAAAQCQEERCCLRATALWGHAG